jgi:hypothetical protein
MTANLSLECRIAPAGAVLQVSYSVTNHAGHDVYVLDQIPLVDRTTRKGRLDLSSLHLAFRAPAGVRLLKGIPPLPSDRHVMVRVIPLGTRVTPGAKLARAFELPLPLQEQGAYWGPADRDQCELCKVNQVQLCVHVLPSTAAGFEAHPASDFPGPDLFLVATAATARDALSLECAKEVAGLELLRRRDAFDRD